MANEKIEVDALKAIGYVTISVKKTKEFYIRWYIGTWFIKLGALICGMGFEVDKDSFGVNDG